MLFPLISVLIWSGNTIVTKAAAGVISPGSISFYRWVLAFLVLSPFVGRAAWRNRSAAAHLWKELLCTSLLGMVGYQCLAYVAAETTSAVNMGVILALMPLFSTLFACVIAAERLSPKRLVGGIVSIGGLVYLASRGHPMSLVNGGLHLGDALMVAAVLSNALYGVLLKRWSMKLPVWEQLFWQILVAIVALLPIWLLGTVSPITARNLPLILFAAIPTSLLAPMCWMTGISRLGAARTALTMNLLPLIVAILAWALLKEQLHTYDYLGGMIALAGVMLGLGEVGGTAKDRGDAARRDWALKEI